MEYVTTTIGVLGLLLAVVAIIYTRRQIQKKELAYEVILDAPLVVANSLFASRLKILFDDTPVDNANIVLMRLWNSGNQPIRKEDFEEQQPIVVTFGEGKIISAEIQSTFPLNLDPSLAASDRGLLVHALLLNARDTLVMQLILTGDRREIEVAGRIAGVRRVVKKAYDTQAVLRVRIRRILAVVAFVMTIPLFVLMFISVNELSINPHHQIVVSPVVKVLVVLSMAPWFGILGFVAWDIWDDLRAKIRSKR